MTQEPLSNFRRDLAAEDETRLLAERIICSIKWRGCLKVARLARRLRAEGVHE